MMSELGSNISIFYKFTRLPVKRRLGENQYCNTFKAVTSD